MKLETYVLHITKKCNMNCIYCYEKDKDSIYSWDQIKHLLDDILKYNNYFNMEFLGGEPCLNIDIIEKTIDKIKSNVNEFYITTNGTIIDDKLILLLKQNQNLYWYASMDGTPRMNCLRVMKSGYNSHDIVIENYKYLVNSGIDNKQLGIHMTIHPYNMTQIVKGVNYLYNMGIRNISIGIVESTILIGKEYCNIFIDQHKILTDMFIDNQFPNLILSSFHTTPNTTKRYYIQNRNKSKTILECYGKKENDIKDSEDYKTDPSFSVLGNVIPELKKIVYDYYQLRSRQCMNS